MGWISKLSVAALSTRVVAAIALTVVASCASPNPTLYTLSVVPAHAPSNGPAVISVREVSIAGYLERSEIVRSVNNNRIDVLANQWWGEPLAPMLSRVLVEDLSQRLPGSVVFGENGAINTTAAVSIEVNIERMDATGPQSVALVAHVAINFANSKGRQVLRTVRLQAQAPASDVAGEVAAMSAAVGQLADGIVDLLHGGRTGS
jgi:uncharacterized lipoprotein YmbA